MLAPDRPVEKRQNLFQRLAAAVAPVPRQKPFTEMGTAGTAVWGRTLQVVEKSPKWAGRQRYITISDMVVNTSIIAAGVHYFLNLIAHPAWTVVPADENDPAAVEAAELVEECLHDLTSPWSSVVRRAGTYRFFGFGVQEWTAKRRLDGRIGLSSIEARPQHTVEEWAVADDGTVEGIYQRAPQTGALLGIPRSKLLYLVDDVITDSPEGTGIFRMLAEPWERLKVYYDLEARAFERDLRGIPVGRVPYSLIRQAVDNGSLTQDQADSLAKGMEDFVKMQVKQSNTSITLDSLPYFSQAADGQKVAAVPQWGLELLQGSSNGVEHLGTAIVRTQHEMARIISTENLLMGESSGNRALSQDKSRNLYLIADAVLGDIVAGVNHDVVAPICRLNGIPEEIWPTCETESVSFKDAETIASVLRDMATAGAVLGPDDPVVEDVRALMGVSPPLPSEGVALPTVPAATDDEADTAFEDDDQLAGGVAKAEPRTLYVHRPLLNAGEVRAWAASQGIETTLPADDMHVTVAFSRSPVDWSALRPDASQLVVLAGDRQVYQFPPRNTPNGALVLKFTSTALDKRWAALCKAGCSWDFPEYQSHVTLTYSVAAADLSGIEPYAGKLIFGPEVFAEVNDGWAGDIREVPTVKKRGVPRRPLKRG